MPSLRRFIQILDAFLVQFPEDDDPLSPAGKTDVAQNRTQTPPIDLPADKTAAELPRVEAGREFVTPVGHRRLHVVKFAGQGSRAKVYQAFESEGGGVFALKVIHELTPLHLYSIAVEISKADTLAAHQLPFSRIVESGGTYVLKEWIEGIPGDDWTRRWWESGADPADPAFKALVAFFRDASARGVHVEDLKSANMMLRNSTEWVVVDAGPIVTSLPPAVVMEHYRERFIRRWIWASRSPFWYSVYWIWCRARGVKTRNVEARKARQERARKMEALNTSDGGRHR